MAPSSPGVPLDFAERVDGTAGCRSAQTKGHDSLIVRYLDSWLEDGSEDVQVSGAE